MRDNADHPVVIGNTVLTAVLAGVLGYGAYTKYKAGEFSWKVAGIGAGVLGVFGVADYFATS